MSDSRILTPYGVWYLPRTTTTNLTINIPKPPLGYEHHAIQFPEYDPNNLICIGRVVGKIFTRANDICTRLSEDANLSKKIRITTLKEHKNILIFTAPVTIIPKLMAEALEILLHPPPSTVISVDNISTNTSITESDHDDIFSTGKCRS